VLGHPVAVASWEGLVIETLLAVAPEGCEGWFYRTAAGAEINLVLEWSPQRRWAIEIKRSLSPLARQGLSSGPRRPPARALVGGHTSRDWPSPRRRG